MLPPESTAPVARIRHAVKTLSTGVKFLLVCVLAVFMSIPGFFVDNLVDERTGRAHDVISQITVEVGGPQTFLGPTLLVPYSIPSTDPKAAPEYGTYFLSPVHASATLTSTSKELRRSLFRVPVFQSDATLDATFDLTGSPSFAPPRAQLDWSKAEFILGISDPRAALSDATLSTEGNTLTMSPANTQPMLSFSGENSPHLNLTLLGTQASTLLKTGVQPGAKFSVTAKMRVSGAQRLAVLAYGRTTELTADGDWHSPSFEGGFLPTQRELSAAGFKAKWTVPAIARNIRSEGPLGEISALQNATLGVTFLQPADTYKFVTRSIKYILLFVGLVFLSYFVFEVTTGRSVHPAQYVLVGIAQTIFYLLLLSLAERLGFDTGFAIAGGATVLLLSANAKWVFASTREGIRAFVVFSILYGLIYSLLRLEDNALLVGAVASFCIVAAVMFASRRLNWYGGSTIPPTVTEA